jgi:hypothetical protein
MPLCSKCKNKTCLKEGKPCPKVEKILRDEGIKRSDWIRPRVSPKKQKKDGLSIYREIPFETNALEELASIRAFNLRYGKGYIKNRDLED